MNSCESLHICLAIQLPHPTNYQSPAQQAQHDKQRFEKNGARLQDLIPALGPRRLGGATGGSKIRACGKFF